MIAVLIWIHMNAYGFETRYEYPMPDMQTCIQSAKSAQISNNSKRDSVSIFCTFKSKGAA
jgi:hypothetical protein